MAQLTNSPVNFRVFKFGGASIKDSLGFQNVCQIVSNEIKFGRLVIIASAIGKTTNALEALVQAAFADFDSSSLLADLINFHKTLAVENLEKPNKVCLLLDEFESELVRLLSHVNTLDFDEAYDRIVSYGEILSTHLLTAVLNEAEIDVELWDSRQLVKTDSVFRAPQIRLSATVEAIQHQWNKCAATVVIAQGFIGSDDAMRTTTLGREGSDYSAAIFGRALGASSVTVWKDVPGVLNADPKLVPEAVLLESLTYEAAAEMTFYGATVLHAKTLKPLAEANIPLYVRSFLQPEQTGTYIGLDAAQTPPRNIYIRLNKVALITCATQDFSFVSEKHMADIIQAAFETGLRILMVQSSALKLKLAVMEDFQRAASFAALLNRVFKVETTYDLALATFIRADADFISSIIRPDAIVMHQQTADRQLILMTV